MTLKNIKYVTRHIIEKAIHLTPKIGCGHKISGFLCNHSTQLTYQFNVLRAVTQLHLGGVCEN
jgi:hypothetical protein